MINQPIKFQSFRIRNLTCKRCFDIGLVILILPIAFSIGILIAIAVVLDSGLPIFHFQTRLGMDRRRPESARKTEGHNRRALVLSGTPFVIFKFRTMKRNAELEGRPIWAASHDCRITRIGRVLRATHLDELPQLLNILRGDMSLVGPRPERPEIVRNLEAQVPNYLTRLKAPAGLTGLAQIRHRADQSIKDVKIKVRYDRLYIRKQSLILDIAILLQTIPRSVIQSQKG